MIKKLLIICLLSIFFLIGGNFHAHAYSLQCNNNSGFAVVNITEEQQPNFVVLPNNHSTFSNVVCGTSLEKSNLDALEDFIDEEDESEWLPYKKNTEASTYFGIHYRNQFTEASHNYLVKSLQRDSNLSFLCGINKYALFCVFRI